MERKKYKDRWIDNQIVRLIANQIDRWVDNYQIDRINKKIDI